MNLKANLFTPSRSLKNQNDKLMCIIAFLSTDSRISLQPVSESVYLLWRLYGTLLLTGLISLFFITKQLFSCHVETRCSHHAHEKKNGCYLLDAKTTKWKRHVIWLCSRPVTWQMAGSICLILLVFQLMALILGKIIIASGLSSLSQLNQYWVIVQGIMFHLAGILSIIFIVKKNGLLLRDIFGVKNRNLAKQVWIGTCFYLAALPIFAGSTIAYHFILLLQGHQIEVQEVVNILLSSHSNYILSVHFILAIVVAPVAEEMLFRGIALPLIAKSLGVIPAMLISSVFFALVHFHIPSLVPLFVLALMFSIAYIHTKNVLVPIIMHALFNGVNLVFLLIILS